MKTCTADNTGITLQEIWPNVVWTYLWPITENATFLWIYSMFEGLLYTTDLRQISLY